MIEKYYRFQKRPELDKESYSEFISDIFFAIGDEENEWTELEMGIKEELIEDIRAKWGFAIDLWWYKHRHLYENDDFEDETEYLVELVSKQDEDSLWSFMMAHKLDGVFAVKTEDYPDKSLLLEASRQPEFGLHNDYLIAFEGEEIAYFGPDYGYLVLPTKVVSIEQVPQMYVKDSSS